VRGEIFGGWLGVGVGVYVVYFGSSSRTHFFTGVRSFHRYYFLLSRSICLDALPLACWLDVFYAIRAPEWIFKEYFLSWPPADCRRR